MKPSVSVKELMRDMLDPLTDNIFDSVATIIDKNVTRKVPKTEADWETIRIGAVAMAEGSYLLKVRRPTGSDAVELSPAQGFIRINRYINDWAGQDRQRRCARVTDDLDALVVRSFDSERYFYFALTHRV